MGRSTSRSLSPRTALARQVADNLVQRCGVKSGDRLLLGVSGGADSMALLALVATTASGLGIRIEVAHFDHALRPESADDAAFVRDRTRSLGLAFHRARWKSPLPGEAAARTARHAFLEKTVRTSECTAIVLAHHLEDQIETVLMRLGRGAGLRGWLGMAWRRDGEVPLLRPLLDVRRAALRAVLSDIGWDWREDASNRDRRLARNRLRHDVLPALDATLPEGWMERFGASLEDLRQLWEPVRRAAATALDAARSNEDACAIEALAGLPEAVQRQALEMWLGPALDGALGRAHVTSALRMIQIDRKGQRLVLPNGWELTRDGSQLVRHPPGARQGASRASAERLGTLRTTAVSAKLARAEIHKLPTRRPVATANGPSLSDQALVDRTGLTGPLTLRPTQPSDRVRLLGAPGSRSIRQILQDRKVPTPLRPTWPVVTDREGIIWVPGIGIADRVRLHPRSPSALRLDYTQKTSRNGVAGSGPSA
jgi:tRNA(Ile)-lysidine synthase